MYDVITHPVLGMEFVRIPAPPGNSYVQRTPMDNASNIVGLVRPFYMARLPLLQGHIDRMEQKLHSKKGVVDDFDWTPLSRVSLDKTEDLISKIYRTTNDFPRLRVPTSCEWEWAFVAGQEEYSDGMNTMGLYPWFILRGEVMDIVSLFTWTSDTMIDPDNNRLNILRGARVCEDGMINPLKQYAADGGYSTAEDSDIEFGVRLCFSAGE